MLNLVLTEESGAAAAARQALRNLDGTLPAPIRDDVLLLVSELVTNAVRHAGAGPEQPLHLQVIPGPRWVVVAVEDEGPGFTPQPTPSAPGTAAGGWGLFLVDQLADRWGVECTTSGSRVWFEMSYENDRDRTDPPRPASRLQGYSARQPVSLPAARAELPAQR